jgi:uncharacterized protein (DUF849 family)
MGPDGELAVDNASQVQRLYRSMQSEKLLLLRADEVRQRLKKT